MSGNIMRKAFGGASWFFFSNVIQKLCSLTLNQLLLRYTSPETFGTFAVQLELLLSCLLILSRFVLRLSFGVFNMDLFHILGKESGWHL